MSERSVKSYAKRAARFVAGAVTYLPAVMTRAAPSAVAETIFRFVWEFLSLCPGMCGVYLRSGYLASCGGSVGADAHIGFLTQLSHRDLAIGGGVYVGPGCVIGSVTLEDDVLVSSHVSIINGSRQHGLGRLDVPVREQPGELPRVTVGRDSWIGERAVVMADVGRHCVVGAGAVVTKPVPDYAIVVGNPARQVGDRRDAISAAAPDVEPPGPDGLAATIGPVRESVIRAAAGGDA